MTENKNQLSFYMKHSNLKKSLNSLFLYYRLQFLWSFKEFNLFSVFCLLKKTISSNEIWTNKQSVKKTISQMLRIKLTTDQTIELLDII